MQFAEMNGIKSCTCIAPVNIAVVKYWGKRNEQLILPANSSLSITLGLNELQAKTTVAISNKFTENRIWLNGKEESMNNARIQNVLKEIQRRAKPNEQGDSPLLTENLNVHICSENNFPTAAGLASSAAGYACLVYSLAKLFGVDGELSDIARQGSGSACRSMYGGFVLWDKGEKPDGTDSLARQVAPADHWSSLRILILVVSDQKKQMGSTEGMQTTMATSELMQRRVEVVQKHIQEIEQAIRQRDFPTFAHITMQESNQFHAVCLDTYPPVFYLTDTSRQIIQLVHTYNMLCQKTKVAYTFDAGPNACLYLMEEDVGRIVALVNYLFPSVHGTDQHFVRGIPVVPASLSQEELSAFNMPPCKGAIKYIIHTKAQDVRSVRVLVNIFSAREVGEGPQVLQNEEESLLNSNGFPKVLA